MSVEYLHHLTGIVVDVALLIGAVAAGVRYRLFNIFGYRWRTDVISKHVELADGSVIFLVDYVINNSGRRPLKVSEVVITVHPSTQDGQLLVPDESKAIAARTVRAGDKALKGIFQIEPGERTIFTLRARLDRLDDYVFIICTFATPAQRTPTVYRSFYIKSERSDGIAEPKATSQDGEGEDDE
jgi:hypothetical protein